ncbi:MAG: hypothetical protein WBO89_10855, partial [Propionicimonas sp.]
MRGADQAACTRKKTIVAPTPQDVRSGESSTDFGANDWLIEELHQQYLNDPGSVDASWAEYFAGLPHVTTTPALAVPAAPEPPAEQPAEAPPA